MIEIDSKLLFKLLQVLVIRGKDVAHIGKRLQFSNQYCHGNTGFEPWVAVSWMVKKNNWKYPKTIAWING